MFICSSVFEDVSLTGAGLAVFIVILCVIVLAVAAVNVVPRIVHKWEIEYKTRDLTYGAVCLALAYALSWAKISLPQGGSLTVASLAPIFIYCYYFGFRKGAVIAAAYTLLQLLQFPFIVSPWSAFFDYILPYFSLCVVGLFAYKPQKYAAFIKRNKDEGGHGVKSAVKKWSFTIAGHWGIFAGAAIHALIRYLSSSLSGVLFFAEYAPGDGGLAAVLAYTFSYNAILLADSAVAIVASVMLMSSRAFNLYMSASFADKRTYVNSLADGNEASDTVKADVSAETETEKAAAVVPNGKNAE